VRADRHISEVRRDVLAECQRFQVGAVVVGWPVRPVDESVGPQCQRVAHFMEQLKLDEYPKTLWNEMYTTELVKTRKAQQFDDFVAGNPRTRKLLRHPLEGRPRLDSESAYELLNLYLASHGRRGSESRADFSV